MKFIFVFAAIFGVSCVLVLLVVQLAMWCGFLPGAQWRRRITAKTSSNATSYWIIRGKP